MLSLDKIQKGISEVRESSGIDSLGENVRAGVGNLRNSVTAGVDRVSAIGRRGNQSNLFSTPSLVSSRPMASISSTTSKQRVRPGKLSLYVKNISTKKNISSYKMCWRKYKKHSRKYT